MSLKVMATVFYMRMDLLMCVGFFAFPDINLKGSTIFVQVDSAEMDDSMSEPMDPFLLKLFSFLVEFHNAREKAVRYRCCQLVNKLLGQLGDEATIGELIIQEHANLLFFE